MGDINSYSARPDGKLTLHEFFALVPHNQRQQLEDDINTILESGFGDLTFHIFNGKLDYWQTSPTRKISKKTMDKKP